MPVSPTFPCPHCGVRAFQRHPVTVEPRSPGTLAHLTTCRACGENYLATVQTCPDGRRVETWDYYLERQPSLRRVRTYRLRGRYGDLREGPQHFFVAGERTTEATWRAQLAQHRSDPSPLLDEAPTPAATPYGQLLAQTWPMLVATPTARVVIGMHSVSSVASQPAHLLCPQRL